MISVSGAYDILKETMEEEVEHEHFEPYIDPDCNKYEGRLDIIIKAIQKAHTMKPEKVIQTVNQVVVLDKK